MVCVHSTLFIPHLCDFTRYVVIKEVSYIQSLAIILGCKVENLTTYSGMPLGSKRKAEKF